MRDLTSRVRLLPVLAAALWTAATGTAMAETRYDRVTARLQALHAQYPQNTELFSIGRNNQGLEIQGLKVWSGSETPDPAAPQALVVGAHHGNESLSVDVALRYLEDTLKSVGEGPVARPDGLVHHVIPVLNISGYNANRREETTAGGWTSDPNRDYPDPCGSDAPYGLSSTKLLADYVQTAGVTAAVTIHGYIGTFTYPWGTYTTVDHTLDHATFDRLARQAVTHNGYDVGTHGGLIYPTVGAFEDWAYYEHGVWVMLLEIENRPDVANDAAAVRAFLANAPTQRSTQHEHTGRCTSIEGPVLGRP